MLGWGRVGVRVLVRVRIGVRVRVRRLQFVVGASSYRRDSPFLRWMARVGLKDGVGLWLGLELGG